MKHLIAFLLFLTSLPALAASPIAGLVTSRTSGTAPLCVHFDATGSTDADTSNPFRDLLYRWNFGDPGAGNWARGANTSLPKNLARGPVAGHCYETAGSYTARLQVCDATACVSTSQAIRVDDPDVDNSGLTPAGSNFTTTNTTCFYNSVVGSGCPTGATETASSDFDAAIAACLASGKRCLFKRGDTFAASVTTGLSGTITGAQVGAYGSGAKPIITTSGINFFNLTGTLSDITFSDLEFVGAGIASKTGTFINFMAATTNMTFLRVTCRDHGACYSINGTGDSNHATGLFIVDGSMYSYTGGNGAFIGIKQSALMGNFVDDSRGPGYPDCPTCEAEHGLRIQYGQKSIVSHNYLGKAWTNKHQLTIRAAPRGSTGAVEDDNLDTNRMYVSDNYFDDTTLGVWKVTVSPSGDTQCHWIRDVIFERNYSKANLSSTIHVKITAKRVTVRNNIGISTASGNFASVSNNNGGTCTGDPVVNAANAIPVPDSNWIGNNTMYHTGPDAPGSLRMVYLDGSLVTGVTNSMAYNNLVYTTTETSVSTVGTAGTTTGTLPSPLPGTNSTDTQARTLNPFTGTPTTAITFRPQTTSYAESGGTNLFPAVAEDFYLCRDRTGAVRYGALVPAARAQCSGTAGAP